MIKSQMKKLRIYKNHDNFFQLGRIGLWEAYKEYDPARGTFQTLAIIKVRGEMLEQLKKERVHDERYTHVELQEFDYIPDTNCEVESILERDMIATYCTSLSHEQKLWVMKAVIEQKKPGEIAEELNVSVERVKSWRKQAIKKIARSIRN